MPTIVVRYFETVIDPVSKLEIPNLLGTEAYENIREVLIPGLPAPRPGGRFDQPRPGRSRDIRPSINER